MAQLPVNKIKKLTDAERDAQDVNESGDLIFNTTDSTLQYDNTGAGGWNKIVDQASMSGKTIVYISNDGNDTTGDGSFPFPWATAAHALTQITDNSSTKPYLIMFMPGSYSDATIVIKPFIQFYGNNSTWFITNPVTLDASFSAGGKVWISKFFLLFATNGYNFDFNSLSPSDICFFYLDDMLMAGSPFTMVGDTVKNCGVYINNVSSSGTDYVLSNSLIEGSNNSFKSLTITKTAAAPTNAVYLFDGKILNASSITSSAGSIDTRLTGLKWFNVLTLTTTASGTIPANSIGCEYVMQPSLDGSGVTFKTDPIGFVPAIANSATAVYQSISDTLTANYTPINYTATNTSVKGNLQGIDTAIGLIGSASLLAVQHFTGNGTYTPTVGATKAVVYLTGGGGGGGGAGVAGTGQTDGGAGVSSQFGVIFAASGGEGGKFGTDAVSGNGGLGSASGGGTYLIPGSGGTTGYLCGGAGGSSSAGGGAAAKGGDTQSGYNASNNSGGGGGGGTYVSYAGGGGGGGATGVYFYTSPASQSVTIGAGGTAGAAGSSGGSGGVGGSGRCIIFEFA